MFCLKCSRAFHPFSPNIRLRKDRFSWQCFQKISQTQIRDYDGVRYLVLFGPKKYHVIYDKIRCLLSHKVVLNILFLVIILHNYAKIKIDSYDSLTLEKPLTLHNVIILIKSVFSENQNHCYYNTFI